MRERLQKILARAGVASRREAERMLLEGKIRVNGEVVVKLGSSADRTTDSIRVDGKLLRDAQPARVTMALHKPRGVVSTRRDPQGRTTVIDLIRGVPGRLYPIGRLDYNAEGLLLLTNDGDLAYRLLRPGAVERLYLVKVRGGPREEELARLRQGILLDGRKTLPARISRTVRGGARFMRNCWLEVGLHEGRPNQIVRMFRAIGHPVLRLRRIRIGPVALGSLPPGGFRPLTPRELAALSALRPSRLRPAASRDA